MVIRPARPGEVEELTELAMRSKAYWGYDEAFMEACRAELTITPQYLDVNPTFVLEDEGHVVGVYSLEAMGEDGSEDGEVELGMLFIDPDAIGHGHGAKLFSHARQQAADLGYRILWIQSDPDAEGFYSSQGAVTVGHKESGSLPGRMLPWMCVGLTAPSDDIAARDLEILNRSADSLNEEMEDVLGYRTDP